MTALWSAVAVDNISNGAGSGGVEQSAIASIETSSNKALINVSAWEAKATESTPKPCWLKKFLITFFFHLYQSIK